MKRFPSSDESEDDFEYLDKSIQLTKSWQAPVALQFQFQPSTQTDWTMTNLPTSTTTKRYITEIQALITRSLPEEEAIFRTPQVSNSSSSSSDHPYTTDTSSSSTIKKTKKTKAEREARRLDPDIYAPSLRPRFVICKGCKEELWPPNCRYHSRHCEFAAKREKHSQSSDNYNDEDKIAVENLVNN
ncbi:hypothetical protein GAYE_SCF24G4412 [Galdieria yellowstonensis]|uniref:Uncharacterized protein n=1 Tax=Galdieria yellowstonensis TaxID=3028027 RepID=A0AAV9IGZ3_9RHOD|nr:hypothetical protein GAYE_SCF24G4412 [Galdieria yellowstonensis]